MYIRVEREDMYTIVRRLSALPGLVALLSYPLMGQIDVTGVTTSPTQAIVQYTSPIEQACSIQVADMNRAITITSATQSSGQVTAQTAAPHGLLVGAVIYLENSGAWDGWQTLLSVPTNSSFVFASAATGGATGGNVGVLVDDVNPALFTGANMDSRSGNIINGQTAAPGQLLPLVQQAGRSRTFVIGKRRAEIGLDGNRYSRALQAYTRHHFTLTCGTQSFDQEFRTANIPTGDTHNEGPPIDLSNPGQYAYPTIQWNNSAQTLIDPLSGLRSKRATAPQGSPSTSQNFVTAIDSQSAWQNPSAPLTNTGGAASFTPPCSLGTCPLFLRADSLSLPGGATYTLTDSSLDWVTVTLNQASVSGQCSGDDCKIVTCLTVNGFSCASDNREAALSSTPANFTFGTRNLMDLWQTSGAPAISRVDASQATGTVNYSAATQQVSLVNGNVFNIKWGPGSQVTIAGAPYSVASVQNERVLTLASGPASDLSGVPYSANNFGVLIWKKTGSVNRISVGYATYLYGSSTMPSWSAATVNECSVSVPVGGAPGYNCFIGQELYWLAADGSSVRDLGNVGMWFYGGGEWSQYAVCGSSGNASQFDPLNGDEWYCIAYPYSNFSAPSVVQAHYMGPHTQYTPGQQIPDCTNDGGVQPCILFTLMQPSGTDIAATGPSFNPALASSGFVPGFYFMGGVSTDGDMLIYTNNTGQDSLGWLFIYSLGDRTPTGTDGSSFQIAAAASTFLTAPLSYCTIHFVAVPDRGWAGVYSNDYYAYDGPAGTYTMSYTSAALNTTPGVAGGLNACPTNPLGVTGNTCTAITVTGPPTRASDSNVLHATQVGDVIIIDSEYMRVVTVTSSTLFTVQRGYTGSIIASHGGTTLTMACGTRNVNNAKFGLWNYRNDPYGANASFTTLLADPNMDNSHNYIGDGVFVASSSNATLGDNLCPVSMGGSCYQIRLGDLVTASQSQPTSVTYNPPFASIVGISGPLVVESHPGPCFNRLCLDGRPMVGGGIAYPAISTLGTSSAPFQPVTGQLWKISGAQSTLHRKYLNTIAYAGRWPLVDVSGPASAIGGSAQDSYKYCYAAAAGECVPDSSVGDVYVNAPYVDYPYCYFPGIAIQNDDNLSICIGDLGAHTANMVQYSVANHDVTGDAVRRLGPNYGKWNQFDVFWNGFMAPNNAMMGTWVRWLDGVRMEDLLTVLPPFPASDGVARSGFIPVSLTINPPPGLPVQSAIVEFGYVENGGPSNYYCTSRQETCVATGSTVNQSAPFSFEQSETYTPAPCAGGCTIAIPALSQHALYYRWKYLGASGRVIETSQAHVVLTQ
jgi:hypothetical protein